MKKWMIATMLLLVAQTVSASMIIVDSMQSKVLNAVRHYCIYLPTGYDKEPEKRYPVLYLLHGFTDDHTAWSEKGQLQTVVDELIGTGEIRPMIVIMPEAGGSDVKNVWNGYFNMAGWPYEQFFFEEFIPTIERQYRIIDDKEHRAISGLSMGGGGSVSYAQKHPEMFSSCYDFSGWLSMEASPELKEKAETGDKVAMVQYAVAENSCLSFLKKADEATLNKLRTVKWFVDCGDDDFLLDLNLAFYQLMRDAKIKTELRVRNGQHNWEYWHTGLRTSLPFASRNFEK